MYMQGLTNINDWINQTLTYPSPWGEIGSSKLVFASPRSSLQLGTDPVAVMNYWDKVIELACLALGYGY